MNQGKPNESDTQKRGQSESGAAASPGDNRTADDVDGNRSGGASKAKGPDEPESAEDNDPLSKGR